MVGRIMEDPIKFRRLYIDDPRAEEYHKAAVEKLQTLFPYKRITSFDVLTIGIQTDSPYSQTGTDTYQLGLIDDDTPAIRNCRDDQLITFRV